MKFARDVRQLDSKVAALAVAHLQLSGRARNVAAKFGTIGGLIAARNTSDRRLSGSVAAEIEHVVEALIAATGKRGYSAWDRFRDSRPRHSEYPEVFFASAKFDHLRPEVSTLSAKCAHLSRRAINAFAAKGIHTIGDLVSRWSTWSRAGRRIRREDGAGIPRSTRCTLKINHERREH